VDDSPPVRVVERRGDLARQAERALRTHRAAFQLAGQVAAFHQLHDEVNQAVGAPEVVDGQNV